jgi:putative ABC transport system permease protein
VAQVDGNGVLLQAMDAHSIGAIADLGVEQGDLNDLDATSMAIARKKADKAHWQIGTKVKVVFPATGAKELTVKVIYENRDLANNYWVDTSVFDANVPTQFDMLVLAKVAPGTSIAAARPAVERVAKAYPNIDVQDRQQFIDSQAAQVNQVLGLVFVMLFLSLVIALFGIANTLALSIVERTREIGLLRAVGMTRRQMRSTIRWEAVLIALFGAIGGLGVGLFFGWSLIHALADQGFNTFKAPIPSLVLIAIAAGVFGVVAAIVPARRAARLNVLAAIAST